jgi:sporulation protein YlmC with PRC-barrel domain
MSHLDLDPNGIHSDPDNKGSDVSLMGAVTLTGQEVYNHENESLGKIKEIMIHVESGEIEYAVLSFGGLLGMGEKLFAVPWQALCLDVTNQRIILDMSKRKLQKMPGFDKNCWPRRSNPQFPEACGDTSLTKDRLVKAHGPSQNWRNQQQ